MTDFHGRSDGLEDERLELLTRRIAQHVAKLSTVGVQPDGSITRLAFSDEESAAIAYVRAAGESFGLQGRYDGVGNLLLTLPGESERTVLVGSHLDSVPRGGNYDGVAGVVAGLEALRGIAERGGPRPTTLGVVVWRGEEFTYNAVYKGSAAAFGASDPHILHNTYGGTSLRDAILQQGFDPSLIDEGRPSLDPAAIDALEGFLELHIEQGSVLEQERLDLGVVTSICGDRRFLVVLEGRFDHSGATPMGVRYRSDVNLAMAYVQVRLDELARSRREAGEVFTQTVGILNADPEIDKRYPGVHGNSVTKVSGMGYFTLDIMAPDDAFLDAYAAEMHRRIWSTAREFGVSAFIEQVDHAPGLASTDRRLQSLLEECCRETGARSRRMPSGAGHDTVVVGRARRSSGEAIPVGMLFVPSHRGISHSREEFTAPEQIARGAAVLELALTRWLERGGWSERAARPAEKPARPADGAARER